jgi:drug/metabolite transporter (DMT)-like permease
MEILGQISTEIDTIATMFISWLLLDEAITAIQLTGTALVLLGVRAASRSPSR